MGGDWNFPGPPKLHPKNGIEKVTRLKNTQKIWVKKKVRWGRYQGARRSKIKRVRPKPQPELEQREQERGGKPNKNIKKFRTTEKKKKVSKYSSTPGAARQSEAQNVTRFQNNLLKGGFDRGPPQKTTALGIPQPLPRKEKNFAVGFWGGKAKGGRNMGKSVGGTKVYNWEKGLGEFPKKVLFPLKVGENERPNRVAPKVRSGLGMQHRLVFGGGGVQFARQEGAGGNKGRKTETREGGFARGESTPFEGQKNEVKSDEGGERKGGGGQK